MHPALLLGAIRFAAERHRDQRRKDAGASPYINHPIAVACVLAEEGEVHDEEILLAAVLHDTVEDTDASFEEIEERFGAAVCGYVREVTDDKSLEKTVRKRLQVEHARTASPGAKQIKVADKICNLRDLAASPPPDWPLERVRAYVTWAEEVVAGCRGVNHRLDAAFDAAAALARASLAP